MATKFPYQTSSDALTRPAKNTTFFQGWIPEIDNANHDLLCAEMSRLAYAAPEAGKASLAAVGFSDHLPIGNRETGTEGFVVHNPAMRLTVLAFRGTESDKFPDLLSDANALQQEHPRGGRVHAGFKRAYDSVASNVASGLSSRQDTLLVTGHSLGAALATLAALDVEPSKVITFGSPRVGDANFCARFNGKTVHRFVNCCDVVTRVAPERFDRECFLQLFGELGNFAGLDRLRRAAAGIIAEGAALSLSHAFAGVEKDNRFTHVAPARYIQASGVLADPSDSAPQLSDQQGARSSYPHFAEAHFADLIKLIQPLLIAHDPIAAVRGLIHGLFRVFGAAPVPLRDLADHAPLNYVSAFTGRT